MFGDRRALPNESTIQRVKAVVLSAAAQGDGATAWGATLDRVFRRMGAGVELGCPHAGGSSRDSFTRAREGMAGDPAYFVFFAPQSECSCRHSTFG
jgi:hypothetical protein